MFSWLIALQVAAVQPAHQPAPVIVPSKRIAKVLAKGDGLSRESAYRVRSVREEYEILRVFGLTPGKQSLVIGPNGKAYDTLEGTDPRTGQTLEMWFDISSFYGSAF